MPERRTKRVSLAQGLADIARIPPGMYGLVTGGVSRETGPIARGRVSSGRNVDVVGVLANRAWPPSVHHARLNTDSCARAFAMSHGYVTFSGPWFAGGLETVAPQVPFSSVDGVRLGDVVKRNQDGAPSSSFCTPVRKLRIDRTELIPVRLPLMTTWACA